MKAFHDPKDFAFTAALREKWREVRDEYLTIRDEMTAWYESDIFEGDWRVFGLFDFPDGRRIKYPDTCCPVTSRLIEAVPRHGAAGFSMLRPQTKIKPHSGYQGQFLRCHLGLIVPDGDCALRIGGETRGWSEGEAMVFDDHVEHEAWNRTAGDRVVLLVDFVP